MYVSWYNIHIYILIELYIYMNIYEHVHIYIYTFTNFLWSPKKNLLDSHRCSSIQKIWQESVLPLRLATTYLGAVWNAWFGFIAGENRRKNNGTCWTWGIQPLPLICMSLNGVVTIAITGVAYWLVSGISGHDCSTLTSNFCHGHTFFAMVYPPFQTLLLLQHLQYKAQDFLATPKRFRGI